MYSIDKQLQESYNSYSESIVMGQKDNNMNTGRPNKRLLPFLNNNCQTAVVLTAESLVA